jgi:murein DD-endopeptidase MepM/ murein hydrolase activator NlpD
MGDHRDMSQPTDGPAARALRSARATAAGDALIPGSRRHVPRAEPRERLWRQGDRRHQDVRNTVSVVAMITGALAVGACIAQTLRLHGAEQALERHRVANERLRYELDRTADDATAALLRLRDAAGEGPETPADLIVVADRAGAAAGDPLLDVAVKHYELRERLGAIEATANRAAARRVEAEAENEALRARADLLARRVDALRDAQAEVLPRLGRRVKADIAAMEEVVAYAGLRSPEPGVGGPFVEPRVGLRDPMFDDLEKLETLLARHAALEARLKRLPLVSPVEAPTVASRFGVRVDPINGARGHHGGVDLAAPARSPVRAAAPGAVVFAGRRGPLGFTVELDHGDGVVSRYGHLARGAVAVGQTLAAGETLGLVGSTGRSTGAHLHFEIEVAGRAIDPMHFLRAGRRLQF